MEEPSNHAEELVAQLGLPEAKGKQPEVKPRGGSDVKDWSNPSRKFKVYKESFELGNMPTKPTPNQLPAKESQNHLHRESTASPKNISQSPEIGSPETRNMSSDDSFEDAHFEELPSSLRYRGAPRQNSNQAGPSTRSNEDGVPGQRLNSWESNVAPDSIWLGPRPSVPQDTITGAQNSVPNPDLPGYSLRNRHHFSLRGPHSALSSLNLSRSHRRARIARDWSDGRKRWTASVACISTALLGLIIGVYAGEVPAIQYSLADEHHYTILGNVVFYVGLAIPTVLFWPLPLLHGRKPYTLSALGLLLALQFPQAVIVGSSRSPFDVSYRTGLLLARALAGFFMGFANINFLATLLDLFGSSLQSKNPHQELVDKNDVRRHGGGMGLWLSIWTWCFMGSIGVGFLIGAGIISSMNVDWGFWVTIVLTVVVLMLNVLTPETRRSPYRRSMAEVRTGTDVSRRIARGEVKMHLYSTGPKNWWEEIAAGLTLCYRMLIQRGFIILAMYMAWIYGQVILVMVLLGALISKYYQFHSQYVGLCVLAISIGALLAVPFQKASLYSRARVQPPRTDSMTFEKRFTRSSHMVRRAAFMILLPFAGLALTLSFGGKHVPFIVPTLFAGLIGFLSNLAIAECHGIIMETYDTSDLQIGMTGRYRPKLPNNLKGKRTNYSCFPRVTAAFAITQSMAFLVAAAATAVGGTIERQIGVKAAIAAVAGVLLILTLLLIGVLFRFKTVQIVPKERYGTNILSGPEDEWKPVIIGHPSGSTRRMSLLELGEQARWTEIRRRNRLYSQG